MNLMERSIGQEKFEKVPAVRNAHVKKQSGLALKRCVLDGVRWKEA